MGMKKGRFAPLFFVGGGIVAGRPHSPVAGETISNFILIGKSFTTDSLTG